MHVDSWYCVLHGHETIIACDCGALVAYSITVVPKNQDFVYAIDVYY